MEIWFADREVAAACCCMERLRARWGPDGGRKLGRRLQQIEAAPTLAALRSLPGRCRRRGGNDGDWMIDVDGVATIVFRPDPDPDTDDIDGSRTIVRAT